MGLLFGNVYKCKRSCNYNMNKKVFILFVFVLLISGCSQIQDMKTNQMEVVYLDKVSFDNQKNITIELAEQYKDAKIEAGLVHIYTDTNKDIIVSKVGNGSFDNINYCYVGQARDSFNGILVSSADCIINSTSILNVFSINQYYHLWETKEYIQPDIIIRDILKNIGYSKDTIDKIMNGSLISEEDRKFLECMTDRTVSSAGGPIGLSMMKPGERKLLCCNQPPYGTTGSTSILCK